MTNIPLTVRHGTFDEIGYRQSDTYHNTKMIQECLGYFPKETLDVIEYSLSMEKLDIISSSYPFSEIIEINLPKGYRDINRYIKLKSDSQSL